MTDADNEIPRLKAGVRLHEDRVRNETVLLAPERVIRLSDTAAAILRLADGRTSIAQIVARLAEEYGAPGDVLARDVHQLLQSLRDRGLVQ